MPDDPPRRGKERQQPAPQPTDLAEKLYALQRQKARTDASRSKEKPDRTQPSGASSSRATPARPSSPRRTHAPAMPNPNIVVSRTHSPEPDEREFSRKLKISPASPRSPHPKNAISTASTPKLFNPAIESGRRGFITAEPDAMSDAASSSYAPRGPPPRPSASRPAGDAHRLFDPKKDNPTKFLSRPSGPTSSPNANGRVPPTPKSSGDYISASSTSSASYAHSTISSNFTLSSTTTDSSASSAIFDHERRSEESSGQTSALSNQLKKVYRSISQLEERIKGEDHLRSRDDDVDRDAARVGVLVKSKQPNGAPAQEVKGREEEDKWKRAISDHKELAEKMHIMLSLTSAPTLPSSLRNVPIKYNLILRLWGHAFHHLLESLRKAANPPTNSQVALEHLQEFIYYAYTFYTCLLEERNLSTFRGAWVEALGDLARYRMAVSAMVENVSQSSPTAIPATISTLTAAHLTPRPSTPLRNGNASAISDKVASPIPIARIDDSPAPSKAPPVSQSHAKQHQYAPSVGVVAARLMELEPEKERWRQIAREWYAKGLATTPGAGKLHHHLGLLSRDKDGSEEELRGVYHFVKSMIALHPFTNSRESVLPLWSAPAQARRQAPDARLSELFVLLQGMLFTRIQLDDFKGVLARFEEKLHIEGGEQIEEREWIMTAVINIGSILEYGRPNAVLRRVSGIDGRDGTGTSASASSGGGGVSASGPGMVNGSSAGTGAGAGATKVKLMVSKRNEGDERKMDVDGEVADSTAAADNAKTVIDAIQISPALAHSSASTSASASASASASTSHSEPELPIQLQLAMELAFKMLSHALRNPTRQASPFAQHMLNPYITIMLTFLATILKDKTSLSVLERSIPWDQLVTFFNSIPRRLLQREQERNEAGGLLLTSGCAPLPEDWCLRGLGWGGKKVYERGFWGKDSNSGPGASVTGTAGGGAAVVGEERNVELEVLDRSEANVEMMDGIIEDEEDEEDKPRVDPVRQTMQGRWVRVARAALKIGKVVNGLVYVPPASKDDKGEWRVEGVLADKVARWKEEARREKEEEERRMRGTRWSDDDSMDVDVDDEDAVMDEDNSEDSEDDPDDSDEIKALKARRRYLRNLLQSSQSQHPWSDSPRRARGQTPRKSVSSRPSLRLLPGYTIFIVDTNILLSSLSMFSSLVESMRWTVIVPLPVIMELDGLASNASPLGEAASAAASYIDSHIRSHSGSLKVQTSRGNFLPNLSIRSELVDFHGEEVSWERNMDDLILRAAIWQRDHWVDRSAFLKVETDSRDTTGASKVVLLSFDRMLRLKARSRDVDAANEQDLASILAMGT
ncbi:hypothetical protein K474DRAFT_1706708 [Panus rudis PR-1116 ss-1]|nr:hypothetical protein K474DRAFT_1706708 [Panus rudis PR-1116 ss-1]